MLSELLPDCVVCVETTADRARAAPLPEEAFALGRASEPRLREFATARECARRALRALGAPVVPILRGSDREPLWPKDVVGSITHCNGYRGAAVAWRHEIASVGVDAEVHRPLPEGVLRRVASDAEREWIRARPGDGVFWDCVLFSAKESVFKAWFPLTRRWLGFEDAHLTLQPDASAFEAQLLVPAPIVDGMSLSVLKGRFRIGGGRVLTTTAVPATCAGRGR